MAPRIIPREGIFTGDFGLAVLQSTVLNPVLTGILLTALKNLSRETILRWSQTLRVDLLSPTTVKTLKYLLIIGAARQANKVLSSLVLNNWERTTWDWKNEVALVTGGSGGIGYHVAVGLASHGITVAVVDVQEPRAPLRESFSYSCIIEQQLTPPAPNAHFYKGDVTTTSGIKSFASAIRSAHGNPTILFNNAGIGGGGTILAEPESLIRKVFEVNTISHFLMVKEFVPAMIASNHGHIITTASMASFACLGGMVDYACTKASALAFHEGLAQELKSYHSAPKVRTTIVHPSWTRTALVQPLLDASSKFRPPIMEVETVSDAIVGQILSGKSGQLILPPSVTPHSLMRSCPGWVQEVMRNLGTGMLRVVSPDGTTLEAK